MKYVQAPRPEKHNGGLFFEHEIQIDLEPGDYSTATRIKEYMESSPDQKHVDYRISGRTRKVDWAPGERKNPWAGHKKTINTLVVRFQDKNKALLFKLGFVL